MNGRSRKFRYMPQWARPLLPGFVAALAVVGLLRLGLWSSFEHLAYTTLFRVRGAIPWDERLVIVEVNDEDLSQIGRFPIPRDYYTRLLEKLSQGANSSIVVMDILFADPSPEDNRLAKAMRQHGHVVLAQAWDSQGILRPPSPLLAQEAIALGHPHRATDFDGLTRSIQPLDSAGAPAIGLAAVQAYGLVREPVTFPALDRPLGINWPGPAAELPHYSLVEIIEGDIPTAALQQKIILVGFTASGLDPLITPFDRDEATVGSGQIAYGIHLHAAVINTLLKENSLTPLAQKWGILLLLMAGPGLSWLLTHRRLSQQLILWSGVAGGWVILALLCFRAGYWLPVASPLVMATLVGGGIVLLDKLRASALLQAQRDFLSTISHEIRTPMNAVIGMAELLLGTEQTAEQREFTEIIHNSGETLICLINDVLDLAKIESGKLELEQRSLDLRLCVEQSLDLVAPKTAEKQLEFVYRD